MPISQDVIAEFQAKAREAFSLLSKEFNMKLVQADDLRFQLVGHVLDVCLYLYPSHIPSVNITLIPKGEQWNKWRRKSYWGATGIWLTHLVAFRKAKESCPDTHFQTAQELCGRIEALIQDLRIVGNDLLRGDAAAIQHLAAYADETTQRKIGQ